MSTEPPRVRSRRPSTRSTRHRSRRRIIAGTLIGLGVLLLALAAAGYRIAQIQRDLLVARDRLNDTERLLLAGKPTAARSQLAIGAARVVHANATLYDRPELSLLKLLPVARQNLQSLEDSVGVALHLTTAGVQVLNTAKPLEAANGKFEVPMRTGAVPIDVIRSLRPQLADLANTLPTRIDEPKGTLVLPPLRSLSRTIYRQADLRQRQSATLSAGLDLLYDLAGGNGPRRYLIAVANAAEMRGTGGMMLSYGELTSKAGTFALDHFGHFDELQSALKQPVAVPRSVPADYMQHFADLQPNLFWRNTNLTGDLTYAAPLWEAMYKQATGQAADGVIQIDSMGLAAMMQGTGPVDVAGLGNVNAGNVVKLTLSDAYARFPREQNEQRQEVLGDVAQAVFKKLVTGDYPTLRPLARALVDAAGRRNVELHMTRATEQQDVEALGVDGKLPGLGSDFAAFTLQNFSGNKLDYYVQSKVTVTGDRGPGRVSDVKIKLSLRNLLPPGQTEPAYVVGPVANSSLVNGSLVAGEYSGLASVYLPEGSGLRASTGDLGAGTAGVSTEGGRSVIGIPVRLDAGQSRDITLDVALPPATTNGYRFVLVPVSRVQPTVFDINLGRGPGRRRIRYLGPIARSTALRG